MAKSVHRSLEIALRQLQAERDRIDRAIAALRDVMEDTPNAPTAPAKKAQRKKPQWSSAKRKEASLRMKRYWAAQRKKKNAGKKKAR